MAYASWSIRLKYTELSARCTARKMRSGLGNRRRAGTRADRFRDRIADHGGIPFLVANADQQIVNRVAQAQEPDVGLQLETSDRGRGSGRSASVSLGLATSSKASISAHSRRTISRAIVFQLRDVLGMCAQPRFQP